MLTYSPEKRYSAAQAYQHKWIQSTEFNKLDPSTAHQLVNRMNRFRVYIKITIICQSSVKLQQAAMMYIVTQLMSNKEKIVLRDIFLALDKNGDGTLTQEELLEGYTKMYGNKDRAIAEVNYMMVNADIDNNGTIDYSGQFLNI